MCFGDEKKGNYWCKIQSVFWKAFSSEYALLDIADKCSALTKNEMPQSLWRIRCFFFFSTFSYSHSHALLVYG